MPPVEIAFDAYYDYRQLTDYLHRLAAAYPQLATLASLGRTFQGREIWAMTITAAATGPAESKPGYYLDAQIHAEEHAGSAVALYTIWHLLSQYGQDSQVTRLVDGHVFYVLPRINPDGAEYALQPPFIPWCGNGRFQPGEERATGLIPEDVDGDGVIAQMRVPDPLGEWRLSATDPRILVQREPGEEGGQYYRLYPEGMIRGYDGLHVVIEKPNDGNLNRNFHANWVPDEYGAGDYPLSEPESAAMAGFIRSHPNIAGINAYHTHGGILLRPSMTKPDSRMSPRDLALFKDLGAVGTRLTGYPTISTFEEFTPDKSKPRRGSLKDWTYEQLGIVSFSTEVWDVETEAGVAKTAYYNLRPRTEEAQVKVTDWVRTHVGERGFRDWRPFRHPQLGDVEIGGLVSIWSYRNPPPQLLRDICHKHMLFNLAFAGAAPRVRIERVEAEALGAGLYKLRAVVANHGYLPTNLTDVAVENKVARPVTVELALDGAALVMNPAVAELGHLAGRNERKYAWSPWGQQWTATTRAAEWLVRVERPDATATVRAVAEKGGTHQLVRPLGAGPA